jgi:hypothetical protein
MLNEQLKNIYRPQDLIGIELVTIADRVPHYYDDAPNKGFDGFKRIKGFFKKGQNIGKIKGYQLVSGTKSVYFFRTNKGYLVYLKADWFDQAPIRKIKSLYDYRAEEKEKQEQIKREERSNTFFDRLVNKAMLLGGFYLGLKLILDYQQKINR